MNTRTIFVVVRGADLCSEVVAAYLTKAAAEERALQIISDMRDMSDLDFNIDATSASKTIDRWNDWWDTEFDMQIFVNSVPLFE